MMLTVLMLVLLAAGGAAGCNAGSCRTDLCDQTWPINLNYQFQCYTCSSATDDSTCIEVSDTGFASSQLTKKTTTPCTACLGNHYREKTNYCHCIRCANSCTFNGPGGLFEYPDPPCSPDGDRVCKSCTRCPVGTACYCPLASGSCVGHVDGDLTRCTACPAGYYRNADTLGVRTCQLCEECPTGYKKLQVCDARYNTRTEYDCQACPAETYLAASKTSCETCATCNVFSREKVPCTSTSARQCEGCPAGSKAPDINSQCTRCADGYYPISGYNAAGQKQNEVCSACTGLTSNTDGAACALGYWVQCTGGTRVCVACDGHTTVTGSTACSLGNGVPGTCTGLGNAAVACSPCAAGTERLSTTPVLADKGTQVCAQCRVGRYKLAAGTGECVACANKPDNSEYAAWGVGVATTVSCPW